VKRLKILALAPDANPESISTSLVCYKHAEALSRLHSVTLVTRLSNEDALRRAKAPFNSIETISNGWLDRWVAWVLRAIFKNDRHSRALTPFFYPMSIAYERRAWKQMKARIKGGEFDVILRLSPINTVLPSAFSFFSRNSGVPMVLGPINGGLPWPKGFSQINNQKKPIDRLRNLYRWMPFARSSYRRAAAIIAGSSKTYGEFEHHKAKLFFVPENGISSSLCSGEERRDSRGQKLELLFLGALVPYKACDLALRAAAPLLKSGQARFTIVGDGPERKKLEELTKSLEIEKEVTFCGMVPHGEAMQKLRAADVLAFPSLREFGGGVVFEALAVGTVPVVADFGGPGDTVHPGIGYKLPLTNEPQVIAEMEKALTELANNRNLVESMRKQGMTYARERLTWDTKAQDVSGILQWVLGQGPKPDLRPPKEWTSDFSSSRENISAYAGSRS
jgi:glycosyltransferase involved in cell wall biosynthesis